MHCQEFLDHYSDFRDGRLEDHRLARRMERHLAVCGPCARRHAALTRGAEALRSLPVPLPSRRFRAGLAHRLAGEVAIGDPIAPTRVGIAAAFLLAAAVALVLYEGLAAHAFPQSTLPIAIADTTSLLDTPRPSANRVVVNFTLPAFSGAAVQFSSSPAPGVSWVSLNH